ncbi:MAG: HAD hydrolase family protein [Eubacteriales bacterium]|nr:HAD hydrolase family protein [Eubacteriales bacterium]
MRTSLSQEELASIEAVFSDLDDTLLTSTKELTPRTIRAIGNLPIPFYIDTGRNNDGISRGLLGLNDKNHLRISLNGNVLVRNGVIVKVARYLPKDVSLTILRLLEKSFTPEELAPLPYDPLHYYAKDARSKQVLREYRASKSRPVFYGKEENLYPVKIIKILLNGTEEACKRALSLLNPFQKEVRIVQNHPTQVEVNPLGVTKGTGIEEIASIYGYNLNHCISIGDSALDLGMFRVTGYKATVKNGDEMVKKEANLLLPSNNEEGVATLLEAITEAKRKN